MKKIAWVVLLGSAIIGLHGVTAAEPAAARPNIQVALLLDTSNSMDGLIDQAKSQLWKIVNEFAKMKKSDRHPDFKVALYEYGNDGLQSENGYIRLVQPLTDDLDAVSESLFALKTNGGSEYCGKVIQAATKHLSWSYSREDLKEIFIAGNEPFTQGDVDYRSACREAIGNNIIINTIYCGTFEEGVSSNWKDGAVLADGKYMNINQDRQAVHIDAPQDKEIADLGVALNATYIPYGAGGQMKKERQSVQDSNAMSSSAGSMVQRAVTKSSANYSNEDWDLVDAVKEGSIKLDDVKKEDLPQDMQSMTAEQKKIFIENKQKERIELQKRIQTLNEERDRYVAEEMKKRAASPDKTLDEALIEAVREQAAKKQFEIGNPVD